MDIIFTPWRYSYITGADRPAGCVFCNLPKETDDRNNLILYRAELNYVIMNLFPYSNGHLMVVPFHHEPWLKNLDQPTSSEMMELAKLAQIALEKEYQPDGFNIGWNLGKSAGAGVAEHLHLHVVPRWSGDASFMSVIGETRTIPEDLGVSYEKLLK
ncbi:MAG: HIT domain-containing protein, partial [Candidatus Obscuribacterales bacterium]|nr:HIT domain-containing protein [Candidatus Obscuribacterales bacterium]